MTAPRLISPQEASERLGGVPVTPLLRAAEAHGFLIRIEELQYVIEGELEALEFHMIADAPEPDYLWDDVLYRYYSYGGELLYIGVTNDIVARNQQHFDKPWRRRDAQYIRVESFPTRLACEMAEACAILDEDPLHNAKRLPPHPLTTKNRKVRAYLDENDGLLVGRDVRWLCECGTPIDPPFEPEIKYRRRE